MAENTVLNLGTGGDTIASDDIGGIKFQRVKLIEGADGVNDGDVSATNPLPVVSTCYPVTVQTDVTRPADVLVYAVGDCISNSTSVPTAGGFTFTSAARVSGGCGIITDAIITSSNDPATRLAGEVFIFNQAATAVNDNVAFVVSDTEIKTCVAVIPFSCFDAGNNQLAHVTGLNIGFTCVGTANLRFLLRTRNAYTPASAEVITVTLKILQTN